MLFDESTKSRAAKAIKREGRRQVSALPYAPSAPFEFLTDADLREHRTLVFDCESYGNYFLVAFRCIETGKVAIFEDAPDIATIDIDRLGQILFAHKLVGFNSYNFDLPLVQWAMLGNRARSLNDMAMRIIGEGLRAYKIEQEYKFRLPHVNHIDLIEVAPLQASLKTYGGRLHCKRLQDLPFTPGTELSEKQIEIVRDYCVNNDLAITRDLYKHLLPQIELRESMSAQYGMDLRSKSDAQIAEAVIGSELEKINSAGFAHVGKSKSKIEPGWNFRYKPHATIYFRTPELQRAYATICAAEFTVDLNGAPAVPKEIEKLQVGIGDHGYQIGGGGLHSMEKSVAHYADEKTLLIDRDVASYYPSIILNQELFPQHLGRKFLDVYKGIIDRRLLAKREGRKTEADGLKITCNGSFGKFGNRFSKLYAPDLLMQVTMSGQLYLLMLIEAIELAQIPVVSANTDGIVIKCPKGRYTELTKIIKLWETRTNFLTEETQYRATFNRDVNNYIAVKPNGSCKTKGVYSEFGSTLNSPLSKNPEAQIITDALQAFLAHNISPHDTIYQCTDIRKFVSVRTVRGGAWWQGFYLGRTVRWYYARGEKGCIETFSTANKVPKTDGARPLMVLPDALPDDLNREWYLSATIDAFFDLGVYRRTENRLV